jgi:glycosyltransferase involved in cell wall biosynthesis
MAYSPPMDAVPMKMAFVVQRYGTDVSGGAEKLCRLLAEYLVRHWQIEIITTCAKDYITWKNFYQPGKCEINGITVWRFPVDHPRRIKWFNLSSRKILNGQGTIKEEIEWMKRQGPFSSPLFEFIETNRNCYHFFIFFTYLYCTTYFGLPLVPEKAVLIPTAHDEPPIYLKIFRSLFHLPRAIIYNSPEEQEFVQSCFKNDYIPYEVGGVGVDIHPEDNLHDCSPPSVPQHDGYIMYIGRVDDKKGCSDLVNYFLRYKKEKGTELKLVLVGQKVLNLPSNPGLLAPGYLPEREKDIWLHRASLVIIPSPYESLSLSLLEAWAQGIPVLVNGASEVLKGHCLRSGAGVWYENYEEFSNQLSRLLWDHNLRKHMGNLGKQYIKENYSWNIIEKKYLGLFERLVLK